MKLLATTCPECGSTDNEWGCSQIAQNSVTDGHLRLNEVSTLFYCGCNYCCETIKTITGDELAVMMTGG